MKYAIRAIKYFFYYCILLAIILFALKALNIVETSSIDDIFRNGYKSLVEIAIMFAVFSGIYPKFGFCKMTTAINGTLIDRKSEIVAYMHEKNYVLGKEEDGVLKFHRASILQRTTRMFEDTVTLTQTLEGIEIEGLRRDVIILMHGLENKLN